MNSIFENISSNDQKKLLKMLEMSIKFYSESCKIPIPISKDIIGVILKGSLEISKVDYNGNKIIIEELTENGIFGESFTSTNDELNIFTNEPSEILFIDYENIMRFDNQLYRYYNQFIKNLLKITNSHIKEKNERIEILSKKTIRDKFLEYLSIESKKHGSKVVYLPFTYTDLSYYLIVDRAALSREINNLKKEGIIEKKGRKITIINY